MSKLYIKDNDINVPVASLELLLNKQQAVIGNEDRDMILRTAGNIKIQVGNKFYDLPFTSTDIQGGDGGTIITGAKVVIINEAASLTSITYPGQGSFVYAKDTKAFYIAIDGGYIQLNSSTGGPGGGKIYLSFDETQSLTGAQKYTVNLNAGNLINRLADVAGLSPDKVYEGQVVFATEEGKHYQLIDKNSSTLTSSWRELYLSLVTGGTIFGNVNIKDSALIIDSTFNSPYLPANASNFTGVFLGGNDYTNGLGVWNTGQDIIFSNQLGATSAYKFITGNTANYNTPMTILGNSVGIGGPTNYNYSLAVTGPSMFNGKSYFPGGLKSPDFYSGINGAGFDVSVDSLGKWTLEIDRVITRESADANKKQYKTQALDGSLIFNFSITVIESDLIESIDVNIRGSAAGKYLDTAGTVMHLVDKTRWVEVTRIPIANLQDDGPTKVTELIQLGYGIGDKTSSNTVVGYQTYGKNADNTYSAIPSTVKVDTIRVFELVVNAAVSGFVVGDLLFYKEWDVNKFQFQAIYAEVVKINEASITVYCYNNATIMSTNTLIKIGNRFTQECFIQLNSSDKHSPYIEVIDSIDSFNDFIENYYYSTFDTEDISDMENNIFFKNQVRVKAGLLADIVDTDLGLTAVEQAGLYSDNAYIKGNFVGYKMILGTELDYKNGILRIKDLETIKSRNITGAEGLHGGGNLFVSDIIIKHDAKTWVNKADLTGGNVITNLSIDTYGHPTNWTTRQLIGSDISTDINLQSNDIGIAKYLRWNNFGNGHILFDASKGVAPNGATISSTNAQNVWATTFGSIMGWNGLQTYGVRVDMARQADVWANAGSYINTDVPINTYMLGLGYDGNWHPVSKSNIAVFIGDKEPLANTIVQRDENGYVNANFVRTPESAASPRSDIPVSIYGNTNTTGYHYSYNATAIGSWLGLTPGNYVRKSPLSINAAGSADNQINNLVTFAYNTSGTPWSGTLLSIGGFNGGNYDLQLNGAYNVNELSFRNRNGDGDAWWPWKRVLYQSFPDPVVLLGGIGSSYQNATLQLQHATTPPTLAFHFAGVVASQISIQTSGRIAIIDNPGTSYEAFIAARITASNGFKSTSFQGMAGDYDTNTTANKIIWTIGDQWNTIATMYGLGYSYNSSFRSTMHQVVVSLAGTQNISLGMDGRIIARERIIAGGGTEGGFENIGYIPGHNNIWRLANSPEYGLGYYQGGSDYIGLHFGNRLTPQHRFNTDGSSVHIGSVTAGKTVIGASDEQVRMIGDNPFISWNRNTGVRIGYMQGTASGNLAIQSETGPLSLGATGGVIVNSLLTVNANIATQNFIYTAVDGTTADPYGIISVTRGTGGNYAYFGMTRAGQAGYSMGIDTGNRMIWGVGAGGASMNTLAYLDLAGRFGTVSNISAGGTVTGAGMGVTQTGGTGQGISLYNGSTGNTIPTYGLLFGLTSSFGTHGSVTGDFATYFTLDGTASRGWVFRTISGSGTNVASIGATGNMYLNGSMTAAGGGFNSHRHLKYIHEDFTENSISALSSISKLSIRKFSYLNNMTNTSLGLIIDEVPDYLKEILLVNNDSVDLYTLHSLSLLAHKETKTEIEILKDRITELEFKLEQYG